MSISLAYDPVLSRVRVAVTGLVATSVTLERSTDQVRWTTVRGGTSLTPNGGTVTLDDYEFAPDVTNWYRVVGPSRYDTFTRSVTGAWGTTTSGWPWLISGGSASDYSVNGNVGLQTHTNVGVLRRTVMAASVDVEQVRDVAMSAMLTGAPMVTGSVCRYLNPNNYYWLRTEFQPGGTVAARITRTVNGVTTDLAVANPLPGIGYSPGTLIRSRAKIAGSRLYLKVWDPAGPEPTSWTLTAIDSLITAPYSVGEQTLLSAGNTNPPPVTVSVDNWALTIPSSVIETGSITPAIGGVWLKSISRPWLNQQVRVTDWGTATRQARNGVFDIIGRSLPVTVSDLRGPRRWPIEVLTTTAAEAERLEMLLASGDTVLVQVPATWPTRGGYVTVGDTEGRHPARGSVERLWTLPVTETAPPGPDVVGATSTWQTVLNTYPTWQHVLNAHPTWASLLELIASPTDVIV